MKNSIKVLCFIAAVSFIFQGCTDKSQNNSQNKTDTSNNIGETVSENSSDTFTIVSPYAETTEGTTSPSVTAATSAVSSTSSPAVPQKPSAPTYKNGIMIVNKSYALPSYYNPGVNTEAQNAFKKMASAASEENIRLFIVSGFRSYSTQESIYNNYVATDGKAEADRYSARPGHSEHQTGLAFDVNSLSQSFENTPEGKWLAANCHKYGFIIRYPKGKENITGYMYEPWHVRYLGKENAEKVFSSGKTLEEYLGVDSVYAD